MFLSSSFTHHHNYSRLPLAILAYLLFVSIQFESCKCDNEIDMKIFKMFHQYLVTEKTDLTEETVNCLMTLEGTEEFLMNLMDGSGQNWFDSATKAPRKSTKSKRTSRCLVKLFKAEMSEKFDSELTAEAGDIHASFKKNLISTCLSNFGEEDQENLANKFLDEIRYNFDYYSNETAAVCEFIVYATEDLEFTTDLSEGNLETDDGSGGDELFGITTIEPIHFDDTAATKADLKLLQTEEAAENSAETVIVNGININFPIL